MFTQYLFVKIHGLFVCNIRPFVSNIGALFGVSFALEIIERWYRSTSTVFEMSTSLLRGKE